MNRRVLIVVAPAAVALAVGFFLLPGRRASDLPRDGAGAARPAPAARVTPPPAVVPTPPPEAPSPARTPASPPTRAPRRAAPAAPSASSAESTSAMLQIESDVPGAQVFVDRVFIGATPLTTTDVAVGAHRLNVSAPGYDGVARDLEVKPGMQQVTVKLREVRLAARLEVIHKHRMGSCRGTLVATPRGLTYETTDADDRFQAPLADLQEFEVDYLQKNLRLRLKQGKRYDFTDPDGNADRLFVFHRDVTQARERLARGDSPARD